MKFHFAERGNIWAQVLFSWHLVCQKEMVYNKNSSYRNHQKRGSSEHIKHCEVGFKCHPLQNKVITIVRFLKSLLCCLLREATASYMESYSSSHLLLIYIFFCLSVFASDGLSARLGDADSAASAQSKQSISAHTLTLKIFYFTNAE